MMRWTTTEDDIVVVLTKHWGWERQLPQEEIDLALETCFGHEREIARAAMRAGDSVFDQNAGALGKILDILTDSGLLSSAGVQT